MNNLQRELITLLNDELTAVDFNNESNLNSVLDQVGNSQIVLLGEASHGTKEFYAARIALSKLLIEKKGFQAIAIEGDWPSAYQVHQFIQGLNTSANEVEALNAFQRFPEWMWRNYQVADFIHWLFQYNQKLTQNKIGFYGLDLYSLHDSMRAIIDYLKKHQPEAAAQAIKRYGCFDHVATDPQMYGYLVNKHLKKACINEVTEQFLEIQHRALMQINQQSFSEQEALYFASQNARLVKNAEKYYRSMFEPRATSWNIRDHHMAQTLNNLMAHITNLYNMPAKIIVWAHNSHVGDARATEMNDRGEINLGQIVREQFDTAAYSLGFSTYSGTVRAASDWGEESEIKTVLPALPGSYEKLFHQASSDNFFLNLRNETHLLHLLKQPMLQRAIGVIYLPETERMSHYYFARLPFQFDGIIHLDLTTALTLLPSQGQLTAEELPETYPTGF